MREALIRKGIGVAILAEDRLQARSNLAWAISVGGIGVVGFAALLLFTWYYAATLFLIFAGVLLGVALNAITAMLGQLVRLPHALRRDHRLLVAYSPTGGVPWVWKDSIVFRPQAWPLARSASVQVIVRQSGASTSRATGLHSSIRFPPGS